MSQVSTRHATKTSGVTLVGKTLIFFERTHDNITIGLGSDYTTILSACGSYIMMNYKVACLQGGSVITLIYRRWQQ